MELAVPTWVVRDTVLGGLALRLVFVIAEGDINTLMQDIGIKIISPGTF